MTNLESTARTFAGIGNENEFFGHHYLAEVFRGDIRDQLDRWLAGEDDGRRAPQRVLGGLGARWFSARRALATTKDQDRGGEVFRALQHPLLAALGYEITPEVISLVEGYPFLVWAKTGLSGHGRAPRLLVVPVVAVGEVEGDLLEQPIDRSLFPGAVPAHAVGATWSDWLTSGIFGADDQPRFVLLVGMDDWLLLDCMKWPNNRLLRFTWPEILDRRDQPTVDAAAALLHRESLAPAEGASLLQGLDEHAHKHAFGVSEDLKFALREAIELLGNDAARQLRESAAEKKLSVFSGRGELDAEQLSLECLRLMYRLLFVLYIEARPELGYVPIGSETYLKGYSLEALRDLELVELTTPRARDGSFFDDGLRRLFRLIHEGSGATATPYLKDAAKTVREAFTLAPLDSRLFDPSSTPLLNQVRFPNHVWQKVIQLLSLTTPQNGRGRRGRVSYQLLSINQLGAVYEALLSFRGFFAKEDLFEVQPAPKKTKRVVSDDESGESDPEDDPEGDDGEGENEDEAWRPRRRGDGPAVRSPRDDLKVGWFVPQARIGDYTDEERVYVQDEQGHRKLRTYPKGTFIYRLAGRDREKSASYYTPQVLTQCLVKYALKELLREGREDALKAKDILGLTVVEPAMGSAAFLNEAVNQLAEKYLEMKRAETGQRIPHDQYARELQRVRMYIADRNVFGVDLNPVAVELAEVSLWLNAIYGDEPDETGRPTPARVPWFGYQLFEGNSLIGARAEVYRASSLKPKVKPAWYEQAPRRLDPQRPDRQPDEIYHFLLPDPGMAAYTDKAAKALYPDDFERLKHWRTRFCARLEEHEIARLQQLSLKIDALWAEHAEWLARDRKATEDRMSVWPNSGDDDVVTSRAAKEAIRRQGLLNEDGDEATPYRRLKLVMDYWCALWFWPIRESATLPSREEWWMEIGAILEGNIVEIGESSLPFEASATDQPLVTGPQPVLPELEAQPSLRMETGPALHDRLGRLRVTKLREAFSRIVAVESVAKSRRFLHWELAFADIFRSRGGFDLILGNPPWIKVQWNESGVLGEANPLFAIRKMSAAALVGLRMDAFKVSQRLRDEWTTELEEAEGVQKFVNGQQNYPVLKGVQTNLYKCFLPLAWRNAGGSGVSAFVHPEGIYDDPKGGLLREQAYCRLRAHFQFQNELSLFEISHTRRYGLNVFGRAGSVQFDAISNLFHPSTIDHSYSHEGTESVPGYKTNDGEWELAGHRDRIIRVDEDALHLFASLYDEPGTPPRRARLPSLHAASLIDVLRKLASHPRRLGDLGNDYISTEMFHETYAQLDGTIVRRESGDNTFPSSPTDWVLSGPHYYVANPFNKTPRRVCRANGHYDVIDLEALPADYLPRTNYWPKRGSSGYLAGQPSVSWEHQEGPGVSALYRLAHREMLSQSGERTLISIVVPPGAAHVNTTLGHAFREPRDLIGAAAFFQSLIGDFRVKTTGMGHANTTLVNRLPIPQRWDPSLACRVLVLNALTTHYSAFWESTFLEEFRIERWSQPVNPRLPQTFFGGLTSEWTRDCALRTDYARRMALVEMDVLVARMVGLTLEELLLIYRVQFAILRQNESDTWFDMRGQVIFTSNRGTPGVGLTREKAMKASKTRITFPDGRVVAEHVGWEDVRDVPDGTVIEQDILDDDTLPNGPHRKTRRWVAPFVRADREEDYRIAWDHFARRAD